MRVCVYKCVNVRVENVKHCIDMIAFFFCEQVHSRAQMRARMHMSGAQPEITGHDSISAMGIPTRLGAITNNTAHAVQDIALQRFDTIVVTDSIQVIGKRVSLGQ